MPERSPTPASVPEPIAELARQREARRAERDFASADALRDRIGELGWHVTDGPGGSILAPAEPEARPERARVKAGSVPSVLEQPATTDVSVHWIVEGWPDDVLRGIEAFGRVSGGRSLQHVVVDVAGTAGVAWPAAVQVLELELGTGWAAGRNAGLRRSSGRIVIVADGSVEPTGDVVGPIDQALAEPGIGVCGPFGLVTEDLREFHESDGVGPACEVDAIEGYLMAMRRATLQQVGGFDERFRFYRTCDIDFSFRVKDAGLSAVVVPLPVRRHTHRMWDATPTDRRMQLSKRNYYRFLDRFRGRFDLTVAGTRPK